MQATEQDAATRVEVSAGEDLRRFWTLSASHREVLSGARSARIARWLFVALTAIYGARALASDGATNVLRDGLSSLVWPLLISLPALLVSNAARRSSVESLALLRGLERRGCAAAHPLARVTLLAKPLVVSSLVLWLCFAIDVGSFGGFALAVLGLGACLLVQVACAGLLVALAALCEQLAPARPQRTFWAFVFIPLLLHSVLPELPSAWHGYRELIAWSVALGVTP